MRPNRRRGVVVPALIPLPTGLSYRPRSEVDGFEFDESTVKSLQDRFDEVERAQLASPTPEES